MNYNLIWDTQTGPKGWHPFPRMKFITSSKHQKASFLLTFLLTSTPTKRVNRNSSNLAYFVGVFEVWAHADRMKAFKGGEKVLVKTYGAWFASSIQVNEGLVGTFTGLGWRWLPLTISGEGSAILNQVGTIMAQVDEGELEHGMNSLEFNLQSLEKGEGVDSDEWSD